MPDNAWIAIVLVIGLVVIVNLGLWFMWRGHGLHDQINTLRRTSKAIRNPWQKEDTSLEELSRRVNALRGEDEEKKNGK